MLSAHGLQLSTRVQTLCICNWSSCRRSAPLIASQRVCRRFVTATIGPCQTTRRLGPSSQCLCRGFVSATCTTRVAPCNACAEAIISATERVITMPVQRLHVCNCGDVLSLRFVAPVRRLSIRNSWHLAALPLVEHSDHSRLRDGFVVATALPRIAVQTTYACAMAS